MIRTIMFSCVYSSTHCSVLAAVHKCIVLVRFSANKRIYRPTVWFNQRKNLYELIKFITLKQASLNLKNSRKIAQIIYYELQLERLYFPCSRTKSIPDIRYQSFPPDFPESASFSDMKMYCKSKLLENQSRICSSARPACSST